MTAPPIVTPRRVTFGDPLLDMLYATINDELYAKRIDKPFQWEEIDGTYIIFIYEKIRLIRHRLRKEIACEQFNAKKRQWESCSSDLDYAFPIMWPIKKAGAYNLSQLNENTVGAVVQRNVNQFYSSNPQYKTNKYLNTKVHHLAFVCEKKWQHRCRKSLSKNWRGALRFWWTNFVDRSVFKTLVSVVGAQASFPISWKYFADLASCANFSAIKSNVENLGVARKGLARISFEKWATTSLNSVIPDDLLPVWGEIELEPISVQTVFAEASSGIVFTENGSYLGLKNVWNFYQHLKSTATQWGFRELNMLLVLCKRCDEQENMWFPAPPKTDITRFGPYIQSCVKLWKKTYPTDYKKWSQSAQVKWVNDARAILKYSCEQQTFSVPFALDFELLKSTHEKDLLESALKANEDAFSSPQKRRVM